LTAPLHLLRGFTGWTRRLDGKVQNIQTVDDAEDWVKHIADAGFDRFCTETTRYPRRVAELKGGSVYFVKKAHTLFRLPFIEFNSDELPYAILMRPQLIRCEHKHVGMVRGWRYLEDADAPRDLTAEEAALPEWYREGA